jgi:hypothetical protein
VRIFGHHEAVPHDMTGVPAIGNHPLTVMLGDVSMIRKTVVTATNSEIEDHSMRVVEWVLAVIAAVAAGVLAFIR